MKKNKIKRKVVLIVAFLFVIFAISPVFNVEYGALSPSMIEDKKIFGGDGAANEIFNTILSLTPLGALGGALSAVVLLVVGLIFLILSSIFGPIAGTWGFPSIDQIVFNGVAIFDPNFINPPANNLVSFSGLTGIRDIIKSIYQTGYVIGGSIFVIGAMIIGIKLAVTSIASEKAYYKEMIGTWLKGLVLMFTVHIIIAGVFSLNEYIVESLYSKGSIADLTFSGSFELPGLLGKGITAIVNFFKTGELNTSIELNEKGIGGLTFILCMKAILGGDLISAIAVAGLLGQTCSLMITYFRRVIVCILLAAIAPYIVAVDFIRQLI